MLWVNPITRIVSVGIEPHIFEKYSRHQIQVQDNWCWAACAEMVATFYGFPASSQAEIVEDTFNGWQDNQPGTIDEVMDALENLANKYNTRFSVNSASARYFDARDFDIFGLGNKLGDILAKETPLIALIGPAQGVGHFVVITELCYRTVPRKFYTSIRYYDPWKDTDIQGKAKMKTERWNDFYRKSRYFIRVELQ